MSKNLGHLSGRKGLTDNLFERMLESARESGTPDKDELKKLAGEYLMGNANVYGTASFYDFLKPDNKGKKVFVCNGTACLMAGTQDQLKKDLETHFEADEIGEMCCLGRCYENHSFHYAGNNYSGELNGNLGGIIKEAQPAEDDYYVGYNLKQPILTAEFPGLEAYYQPYLAILGKPPQDIIDLIKESGVRGRGGAGFPMGFKWESCANVESDEKFIVCNADEGDPGAYTDRYLLEKQPHSVLLGMMVAGYCSGASHGVVYIRAEYPESISIMRQAIHDLDEKGWIGDNILGSGFDFWFKIIEAAGAYICGEETALLSSIEGQRPEVRIRPPFPTQEGLFNKPTIVNNVETFACVQYILDKGPDAFSGMGRGRSTGPKLICLDSYFNRPGVYEVEMGTPLESIVYELGKGFKSDVKAIHIGGPLGGLIPISRIPDLTLDFESFAENGFLLGHGSILSLPSDYPIIKYIEHLFEFTAHESCGKCFPCRLGSVRGQEMMEKAYDGDYKIDRKLLQDLVKTMEIGSLCALGGGVPLPIRNAMQYFEEELLPYYAKTEQP